MRNVKNIADRITISIARDTTALLEREAIRQGVSVSEVVRRAVARVYQLDPKSQRRLGFAALGRSGMKDTARNADAILAREWSDEVRAGGAVEARGSRRSRGR
jgi:hypothetical protein